MNGMDKSIRKAGYEFETINESGCDSAAIINLTVLESSTSLTVVTSCDNYVWNGVLYEEGGEYTYNTFNEAGCDSVATMILTITQSTSSSTDIVSCDSYQWNDLINSEWIYSYDGSGGLMISIDFDGNDW